MTLQRVFLIGAVVLFLLALLLMLLDAGSRDTVTVLTLGGLASFAAGHL